MEIEEWTACTALRSGSILPGNPADFSRLGDGAREPWTPLAVGSREGFDMKGTPMSLWLSAANRATGWWMGHAANAVRQQQNAALNEMTKAVTGAKPKRKRTTRRRKIAGK